MSRHAHRDAIKEYNSGIIKHTHKTSIYRNKRKAMMWIMIIIETNSHKINQKYTTDIYYSVYRISYMIGI